MNAFSIIGDVLFANLLTIGFLWGGWKISKDGHDATWWAYVAMLVPLAIIGISGIIG